MGKVIGDFRVLEEGLALNQITQEEYQAVFSKARVHGLDDSIYPFAVGGSDAPVIMGESPFSTPLKLQRKKLGLIQEEPDPKRDLLFLKGHLFETPYRELFSALSGIRTEPCYLQIQSEIFPHCVANIDGLCRDEKGQLGLYEGKTTENPSTKAIFKRGDCPRMYYIQVQFYLEVIDKINDESLEYAYICCGWGLQEDEIYWVRIPRDRDYGRKIVHECERFVADSEQGIAVSNSNVSNIGVIKKDSFCNYGPVNKNANPLIIEDDAFDPVFSALEECRKNELRLKEILKEKKEKIKVIDDEYSAVTRQLKEVKKYEEALFVTFVDLLKEKPKAIRKIGDKVFSVTFDNSGKPCFDESVKKYFKEEYPDVWLDVMTHKPNVNRNFKLVISKEKIR